MAGKFHISYVRQHSNSSQQVPSMMKVLPMIYVPIRWNSSPFLIMPSLHSLVLFTGDLLHFAVLDNNDFLIKIFGGEIFAFFNLKDMISTHTRLFLKKKGHVSKYFGEKENLNHHISTIDSRCSQNIMWFLKKLLSYL